MKLSFKILLMTIVGLCWSVSHAQLDNPNNTSKKGHRIERESSTSRSHSFNNRGINKAPTFGNTSKRMLGAPDDISLDRNDKDEEIDITENGNFIQRSGDYTPGYLKKKEGKVKAEYSHHQDLGEYYSSGKFIKISWRDAEVVDGDRVDIIVNGEVVVSNVTLLADYHSLYIDLGQGFTKIEFKALNQGESGPNTADFKVEEDDGSVLTHDQWNLTTGTKASLVVIKN